MACGILRHLVLFGRTPRLAHRVCISTTCPSLIKWRYEQDVEPNPNRYGKLTNLPDYSFVDGRPVPLGMNAYKRMKLQEEYCRKIVQLSGEIDFAIERHKKMVEQSQMAEKKLLESKLRPKGVNLLQKIQKSKK